MVRFGRRTFLPFFALLALGSVGFLPGCDWLTGSDNVQRRSPFISDLVIGPFTVFCGEDHEYSVSFRYDDPQGDIARAVVNLELEGDAPAIEKTYPWPDDIPQNNGTVTFSDSFTCDDSGGRYKVTVWVEDDGGHKSNVLSGSILLSSAG